MSQDLLYYVHHEINLSKYLSKTFHTVFIGDMDYFGAVICIKAEIHNTDVLCISDKSVPHRNDMDACGTLDAISIQYSQFIYLNKRFMN